MRRIWQPEWGLLSREIYDVLKVSILGTEDLYLLLFSSLKDEKRNEFHFLELTLSISDSPVAPTSSLFTRDAKEKSRMEKSQNLS